MHRTRRYPRLCAVVLASTLLSSATRAQLNPRTPADLVIKGGRIITLDEARPEVSALAVLGDRILALGGYEDVKIHVGDDTRILDMEGLFVTPGWIEGHGHFLSLGESLRILDLNEVRDWREHELDCCGPFSICFRANNNNWDCRSATVTRFRALQLSY